MKRGDIVAYIKRSNIPLKVISDPFDYGGGNGRERKDVREEQE